LGSYGPSPNPKIEATVGEPPSSKPRERRASHPNAGENPSPARGLPAIELKTLSPQRSIAALEVHLRLSPLSGESLPDDGLEDAIDGALRHIIDIIHAYGGNTYQYNNRELTALFGHPVPHEDALPRAASAALQLREALGRYASDLEVSRRLRLQFRMGLAAGQIESSGQEVLLVDEGRAACTNARTGDIVLTGEARSGLARDFLFEGADEASRLVGVKPGREIQRGLLARRLTPLAGRRRELDELLGILAGATAGEGSVVAVRGPLGMGKSRLALEVARAAQEIGTRVVEGRCPTSERAAPMAAWAEVARQLGRASAANGPREESYRQILSLLTAAAGPSPLLVVLEDAEHADLSTEQLCVYLDGRLQGVKLMVLYLTRSMSTPLVRRSVTLAPLGGDEARSLIAGALGVAEVPAAVYEPISARAEGNPLILEELVTGLMSGGALLVQGGRAYLQPERVQSIPHGFSAIVLERLSRLPESARQMVKFASVLGRQFHRVTLESLLDAGSREVSDNLESAVAAGLLEPRGPGFPGSYRFRHALTQEALYGQITEAERVALHQRAFGALLSGANPAASGHHAYAAGRFAEAYPLLVRAAREALSGSAYREAVAHFNRALVAAQSLDPEGEDRRTIEICEGRGAARSQLHDIEGAITDFRAVAEAAKRLGERKKEGEALAMLASAYLSRFVDPVHEDALNAAFRAGSLAREVGDELTLVKAQVNIGLVHQSLGDLRRADAIFSEALSLSEEKNLSWGQARSRFWLGANAVWRGEFRNAVAFIEPALSLLERSPDQAMALQLYFFRSLALGGLGEFGQAIESMDTSCAIGDHIGNGFARSRRPNVVGWTRFEYFDFAGARAADEEGIEMSRALNFRHPEISARVNLGRDLVCLGELSRAREVLDDIRRRVEREGDGSHRWRWLLRISAAQSELERAEGRPAEAREFALESLSLALKTGSLKYVSLSQLELARAALDLSEPISALGHLVASAEVARALECPSLHLQIEPLLADLRSQQGRQREAIQHRQAAAAALAQLLAGAPDDEHREFLLSSSVGSSLKGYLNLEPAQRSSNS
jgi:tetratricopeptide (TPR) repeat protein